MIIVAGHIETHPGRRDAALANAAEVIVEARNTPGCLDFFVAPDPIQPDWLVTFERWENEEALAAFRGDGPSEDEAADFREIHVHDYTATLT